MNGMVLGYTSGDVHGRMTSYVKRATLLGFCIHDIFTCSGGVSQSELNRSFIVRIMTRTEASNLDPIRFSASVEGASRKAFARPKRQATASRSSFYIILTDMRGGEDKQD